MVFLSEMIILMSIAFSGSSGSTLISRPTDVMNEYIDYLYNSLVRRGYLSESSSKGYKLTSKGSEALLTFLNENRAQAADIISQALITFLNENRAQAEAIIKELHQLGVESTYKMEKLGKVVMDEVKKKDGI